MITRSATVAILAAACGNSAPAEKGTAAECFGYTAPKGWEAKPSKTKADLVLMNPVEFQLTASKMMRDNFTVRFIPFPGPIDAFERQLLAAMTQENVNQTIKDNEKANPAVKNLQSGVPKPAVTPVKLGGRDGFRVDTRNPITLDASTIVMVTTTMFAKFGDEVVDVSAGYVESREAEVKPLVAAFLASINFDRCK